MVLEGNGMKSLKVKLNVVMCLLVTAFLFAVTIISHNESRKEIMKGYDEQAYTKLKLLITSIDAWLTENQHVITIVAEDSKVTHAESIDSRNSYLLQILKQNPLYESLAFFDNKGEIFLPPKINEAYKQLNISERSHFQRTMQGEFVITDPMVSKGTGNLAIILTAPVKRDGVVIGGIAASIPLNALMDLVMEEKLGETGYPFVFIKSGLQIAHKNNEQVMKRNMYKTDIPELATMANRAMKGETGKIEYVKDGEGKYGYFSKAKKVDWGIAITLPVGEAEQGVYKLFYRNLLISSVGLLIFIIVMSWMASKIVRPIRSLNESVRHIANGDLSYPIASSTSKDEVGQLTQGFSQMAEHMSTVLSEVKQSTYTLGDSAHALHLANEEMKASSEQVAITMNEFTNGTNEIASSIQNTAGDVEDMNLSIQAMSNVFSDIQNGSKQAQLASAEGLENASATFTRIQRVAKTIEDNVESIRQLNEKTKDIEGIVTVITSIANQTNLLALNATIEAARAGEQGKGFAVVADEVRKLAEQTAAAVNGISDIVSENQRQIRHVVAVSEEGMSEVIEGSQSVQRMNDTFHAITDKVGKIDESIQQFSKLLASLAEKSILISQNVENVSSITEQFSAGAEEINASSEEQLSTVKNLMKNTEQLETMSEDLTAMVNRFKTS